MLLFLHISLVVFGKMSLLFEYAIDDRRESGGGFVDLDTCNMLVPGMRIPGIGWQCQKKDGGSDIARNIEFGICEVADSFLKARDMSRDITTGGELLGQSPEPEHNRP